MIQDINEHEFPSHGWFFRQPQTGWTNPYAMVGFQASVDAIVKHRLANRAITQKHGLATHPAAVAEELKTFTRRRLGLPNPIRTQPSFFRASSNLPSRVAAVAADIKTAAQGAAVVLDWLTSGGPSVAQELAEKRAAICTGGDNWVDDQGQKQTRCRFHVEGSWYTVKPADLIKSTLEARKDLTLETPLDDQLKSCGVCKCLMRLKVWVPIDYIAHNTRPETMAQFPPHCWIKCESASATSP